MRRRNLEQVAVGDGLHLVNGLRRDAISLPDPEIDGNERLSFPDAIDELAGEQVDRLVLDVVILLGQHFSSLDMENLSDVLVGVRPDGFMAPGLWNSAAIGTA